MSGNVALAIDQAFAKVPPPAPDNLCASSGDEAFEDTEAFRDRPWQGLDANFLDRFGSALFWFTPQAFHYYLPAFLKGGLTNPHAVFVVTILQLLHPTSDLTLAGFRQLRWECLDEQQIAALEEWLHWLLTQTRPDGVFGQEIQLALRTVQDRHWW